MLDTHDINVPPFYSANGELIRPSEYASTLPGATVAAYFTLTHWRIPQRKDSSGNLPEAVKHAFTPEITYLRVIRPPVRPVPKKRVSSSFDPYDSKTVPLPRLKKPRINATASSSSA
jgi:hypothetical protein